MATDAAIAVGLSVLLTLAWCWDRLPSECTKGAPQHRQGHQWLSTLESQGPVLALLTTIYTGITSQQPVYVFADALSFGHGGSNLIRWLLWYLVTTALYLNLQYASPIRVFERCVLSFFWLALGLVTLNKELDTWRSDAGSAKLTHVGAFLTAMMALSTGILWMVAELPEPRTGGERLLEDNRRTFLDEGGLVTRLTYTFATPYYQKAHTKVEDLPPPKEEELVDVQNALFRQHYDPNNEGKGLSRATIQYMKDNMIHIAIMHFLSLHFRLLLPLSINVFYDAISIHAETREWNSLLAAVTWAVAMFVSVCSDILTRHRIMFHGWRYGIWTDAVYSVAIYDKCLRVAIGELRRVDGSSTDASAGDQANKGRLINMLSQDVDRISQSIDFLPDLVMCPYRLIILFCLLFQQSSAYAVVSSLVWVCLFLPIIFTTYSIVTEKSTATRRATDVRLRAETEFLHAIRALKIYGWIEPFVEKIRIKRVFEVHQLLIYHLWQVVSNMNWYTLSSAVTIAVFGLRFLFTSAPLDPKQAITLLTIIGGLHYPLSQTPAAIMTCVDGYISYQRVKAYLGLKEKPPRQTSKTTYDNINGVVQWNGFDTVITNGDIRWNGSDTIILKGVNLCVKKGQLVTIIGKVGSGKTCLLETLIGESDLLRGNISVNGSIAYAAQGAWIQSTTLRDNILCGLPFNEQWYATVVQACCLIPDFKQLHKGDMTQVGEQGITLSGGQKQRIALARAVYAQTDIVILDDILSAVDFMVAQQIVDIVFKHLLKDKTVILATHRISVAKHADLIVILDQGICNVYRSVTEATTHPVFKELLDSSSSENQRDASPGRTLREKKLNMELKEASLVERLDNDTTLPVGHTTRWRYMHTYIKCCGGFGSFCVITTLYTLYCFLGSFVGYYVSYYADRSTPGNHTYISAKEGSLTVTAMTVAGLLVQTVAFLALAFFSRQGSVHTHGNLLTKIQNARMAFFESTPTGNIISRLSKDMAVIDDMLPETMSAMLDEVIWVTANTATVIAACPYASIFLLPLYRVLENVSGQYTLAYASIVRLMTALKAPVYTHVSETVNGLATIRAFGYEEQHQEQFKALLGNRVRANHSFTLGSRWIGTRMELANAVFTLVVAIVAITLAGPGSVTYSVFAVQCSLRVSIDLAMVLKILAMNDGNLVSISRLAAYDDPNICPQEPQVFAPNDEKFHEATVEFKNVKMRYGPDLPWVLNDLSFFIPNGAKVGVIGRTGAGKTSLLASLLRLVDIECGDIQVDGRSIFSMSIEHIRNEFAVIPQDPVLFCGTLRLNLDPMNEHTDIEIEEALRRAHLLDFVRGLPRQLDTSIDSTGSNISFGQRQLVCLARVLLKDFSILLMDEATSSVDPATDQLIQTCIRQEFGSKTLITIAHRIQTILDYDLILGMRDGTVVEFDTPTNLLNDPKSLLSSMLGSDNASSGLPTVPAIL